MVIRMCFIRYYSGFIRASTHFFAVGGNNRAVSNRNRRLRVEVRDVACLKLRKRQTAVPLARNHIICSNQNREDA
jgi:hypothetical protein